VSDLAGFWASIPTQTTSPVYNAFSLVPGVIDRPLEPSDRLTEFNGN
jgi:hypothetical protein